MTTYFSQHVFIEKRSPLRAHTQGWISFPFCEVFVYLPQLSFPTLCLIWNSIVEFLMLFIFIAFMPSSLTIT